MTFDNDIGLKLVSDLLKLGYRLEFYDCDLRIDTENKAVVVSPKWEPATDERRREAGSIR